ncbi:hypothetical protein D3C85_1376050 [compost metagenome]
MNPQIPRKQLLQRLAIILQLASRLVRTEFILDGDVALAAGINHEDIQVAAAEIHLGGHHGCRKAFGLYVGGRKKSESGQVELGLIALHPRTHQQRLNCKIA